MKISLLTSGITKHYQIGLLSGLLKQGVEVEFIGDDAIGADVIFNQPGVTYFNLCGELNPNRPFFRRAARLLKYYAKHVIYALQTDSPLFHIQWESRFVFVDRYLFLPFYKLCGKKLVYTAHNVNVRSRDGKNHLFHRLSLKWLYSMVDGIIVHTRKMKEELMDSFDISAEIISVIPMGVLNQIEGTGMTQKIARSNLSLPQSKKVILFFGSLSPYKGLENLIESLKELVQQDNTYFLIIAGTTQPEVAKKISAMVENYSLQNNVFFRFNFIPDEEVEKYFMAADCIALPYIKIFQSAVLFLAYGFGLPVIATDVGSFREDIIEEKTGYVSAPENVHAFSETIKKYFSSALRENIVETRNKIKEYANEKYSWEKIGMLTNNVYKSVLRK